MAIQTSLHQLHSLNRADGSATYTSPRGHVVLAAVNGPVEVQRRDELPEEAHVEVNLLPPDGVGQVKERHLELIIRNALRSVVHIQLFPRQMVQLTLQILKVPVDDNSIGRSNPQSESYLPCLPWLLNAACLGLLDAAIPMRDMTTSTIVALTPDTTVREHPTIEEIKTAKSVHVFTFSSKHELLLAESEGRFGMDEWKWAEDRAKYICLGDGDLKGSLQDGLKLAVKDRVHNLDHTS